MFEHSAMLRHLGKDFTQMLGVGVNGAGDKGGLGRQGRTVAPRCVSRRRRAPSETREDR